MEKFIAIPEIDVVFELTIKHDDDGFSLLRVNGWECGPNCVWRFSAAKYTGTGIALPRTRKFKLVTVDGSDSWAELITRIREKGRIPEGQWLGLLVARLPHIWIEGITAVADDSWMTPVNSSGNQWRCYPLFGYSSRARSGINQYPFQFFRPVDEDGVPSTYPSGWRWLVEVE